MLSNVYIDKSSVIRELLGFPSCVLWFYVGKREGFDMQRDNLMEYYASICHKPTTSLNRKIINKIEKDENSNLNSNSIHNTTGPSNYQKLLHIRPRHHLKYTFETSRTKCHTIHNRYFQPLLETQSNTQHLEKDYHHPHLKVKQTSY